MEEVMAGEQLGEKVGIRNVGAKLTISYFCSYHEQESNSTQTVLRSLLHQLLQLHPRGQNVVLNILLERQRRGFQFSFEVELLWRAIREVLCMDGLEEVFVIVDAIEELGHQGAQALLSGFTNMVEMLNRHVGRERRRTKFFFSSRPNANHKRNYPDMHILNIQRSDVERSIRKYIQDSVDQFALDESYFSAKVDEFGPIIVNKISLRADGMFLWASIAWDNFSHGIFWNDELLQQKLDDLEAMPPGINPLYERMLGRIEPSLRKDMLALFSILALAKRPLVEAELGEMLAVCMSKRQTLIRPNDVQPVQNIINAVEKHFCDLVEIHHDGTVLFSHLSFKEYLMHNWSTDRPEILEKARVSMAAACLGYIAYWDDLASDEREHGQRLFPGPDFRNETDIVCRGSLGIFGAISFIASSSLACRTSPLARIRKNGGFRLFQKSKDISCNVFVRQRIAIKGRWNSAHCKNTRSASQVCGQWVRP
jgi:hypothetical protein